MTTPSDYEVYFDIVSTPYNPPWPVLVVGILFSLAAASMAMTTRHGRAIRVLVAIAACLGVALTAFSVFTHWNEYRALRFAASHDTYRTLESRVRDFRRDPTSGDGSQTFSVSGQRFLMNSSDITAGYNQTVSQGGPDLTDKCVRVSFITSERTRRALILWLGARRSGCADEDS